MKEFRPRLTSEMLQALCEAIDTEATKLALLYTEKRDLRFKLAHKLIETDPIHFDKDPEYQKLCEEEREAERKVKLLEDIEVQFKRLLNTRVKGRREGFRPWRSRLFHPGLRGAR